MAKETVDISDKSMKSFAQLFRESDLTGDRASFLGVSTSLVKNFDKITGNMGDFFKESIKAKIFGKTNDERDGNVERTGFIENILTGSLFKSVEKIADKEYTQPEPLEPSIDDMSDVLVKTITESFDSKSVIIKRLDDVKMILNEIMGEDKVVGQLDDLVGAVSAETGMSKEDTGAIMIDEFTKSMEEIFTGNLPDMTVLENMDSTLGDTLEFEKASAKKDERTRLENAREGKRGVAAITGLTEITKGPTKGGLLGANFMDLNLMSLAGLSGATVAGIVLKGIGLTSILGAMAVAIGAAVVDAFAGMDMAEELGVSKLSGAVAGIMSGTGEGLMAAVANTGKWAAMGAGIGLVFGPPGVLLGAIIGAAIGALASWIGFENMANGVQALLDWGTDAIGLVFDAGKFVGDVWNSLPANMNNLKNDAERFIQTTWADLPNKLEEAKTWIGVTADSLKNNVLDIASNLSQGVDGFVKEHQLSIPANIVQLGTNIGDLFGGVWGAYSNAVGNLVDGIGGLLGITDGELDPVVFLELVTTILGIPAKLIKIFTDIFDSVIKSVKEAFDDFVNMLKRNFSLEGIQERAQQATDGAFDWLGGLFPSGNVVKDAQEEFQRNIQKPTEIFGPPMPPEMYYRPYPELAPTTDLNSILDNVERSQTNQSKMIESLITLPPAPRMNLANPLVTTLNNVQTNTSNSFQIDVSPFSNDPSSTNISTGVIDWRPRP